MTQSNGNTIIIGITGNSGSGKTTVATMLSEKGGHKIDADITAHRIMEPGGRAYKKIVAAFGPEILDPGGGIDRGKLGQAVFSDETKRTQLENIVHPLVEEEILAEIETKSKAEAEAGIQAEVHEKSGVPFFIIDAVLLVESGLHRHCDEVWLIKAEEEERMARIIARDDLDSERAAARMRNQRDTTHIAAIAQAVIDNNGDLERLREQVEVAVGDKT